MGIRKRKALEQETAAKTVAVAAEEHKPSGTTFLAPTGELTDDQGSDEQPQSRPRISDAQKPLRTFFDGAAALGPISPLSTHRAQHAALPQTQARLEREAAAKREDQQSRSRRAGEFLMGLLTK